MSFPLSSVRSPHFETHLPEAGEKSTIRQKLNEFFENREVSDFLAVRSRKNSNIDEISKSCEGNKRFCNLAENLKKFEEGYSDMAKLKSEIAVTKKNVKILKKLSPIQFSKELEILKQAKADRLNSSSSEVLKTALMISFLSLSLEQQRQMSFYGDLIVNSRSPLSDIYVIRAFSWINAEHMAALDTFENVVKIYLKAEETRSQKNFVSEKLPIILQSNFDIDHLIRAKSIAAKYLETLKLQEALLQNEPLNS